MIISDFLQEPEKIIRGINHLHHDGKDVTLFHLMDPAELNMAISGLLEVVSMEQEGKLIVDFGLIKESYLKQLRLYLDQLRTGCQGIHANYIFADTGMDVYDAILQRRKIG